MSITVIESTAAWRGTKSLELKVAMEEWAGLGILTLLFLASLAYVASGGTLALEASPVLEAEAPTAAATLKPVNTDIGPQADSGVGRSSVAP